MKLVTLPIGRERTIVINADHVASLSLDNGRTSLRLINGESYQADLPVAKVMELFNE